MSKGLYVPCKDEAISFDERIKKNWQQLRECDEKAKEAGTLVGRFITEPYADSSAVYQIIRENKNSVRILVCTGIGDDWTIPYWGEQTTIPKSYALQKLQRRDGMATLVASRSK